VHCLSDFDVEFDFDVLFCPTFLAAKDNNWLQLEAIGNVPGPNPSEVSAACSCLPFIVTGMAKLGACRNAQKGIELLTSSLDIWMGKPENWLGLCMEI